MLHGKFLLRDRVQVNVNTQRQFLNRFSNVGGPVSHGDMNADQCLHGQ